MSYLLLVFFSYLTSVVAGEESVCGEVLSTDISWLWYGALTPSSIHIKFGLPLEPELLKCYQNHQHQLNANFHVQVLVKEKNSHHPSLVYSVESTDLPYVKQIQLTNLPFPNQTYVFQISRQNQSTMKEGEFRTPLVNTPFNFTFALSSCADEQSDPQVFHSIQKNKPLFFLHMGDIHYHDIAENRIDAFRNGYYSIFQSPAGKAMLNMNTPFVYMWDDHDFGPDNSDKTAPGQPSALFTYRQFVPHYPLNDRNKKDAVYQSFKIGRVHFIISDLRSHRDPNILPDSQEKSVLGEKQKEYFKNELLKESSSPDTKAIVWCSTMPWIDDERKWGHFQFEQQQIVAFIKDNQLNKKVPIYIVSGDAHMIAVDDGRNSPGRIPVFHAAALGRPGSVKGGPYSHGAIPGSGHFGTMDVIDDPNGSLCLRFSGRSLENNELLSYNTCDYEKEMLKATKYYPPPKFIRPFQRRLKKIKKFLRRHIKKSSLLITLIIMVFLLIKRKGNKRKEH